MIVHVITRKGEGYEPARAVYVVHQLHQVNPQTNPETGLPFQPSPRAPRGPTCSPRRCSRSATSGRTWSGSPPRCSTRWGLHKFAQQYPDRIYDVGIAEQHAATCAAGLAFVGLHPVVAVYATFLNRAFDQVLMGLAL